MTRPRFRICPEGLDGWYVEQMYLKDYTVKVGFFFSRTETRQWERWKKVYMIGYNHDVNGKMIFNHLDDHIPHWGSSAKYIPWPCDKDEIKKILDKEIKKYDDEKSYADLVDERLRNTLPEEYP